jgi:hypothetical protein
MPAYLYLNYAQALPPTRERTPHAFIVSPSCRPHAHPDERQFKFVYCDRGGADMLAGDLGGSPLLGQNFRDRHQAFGLANLYGVITAFR